MLKILILASLLPFISQVQANELKTFVSLGGSISYISTKSSFNRHLIKDLAKTTHGSCLNQAIQLSENETKLKNSTRNSTIAIIFEADVNQLPTHIAAPRIVLKIADRKSYQAQLAPDTCDLTETINELIQEHQSKTSVGLPPAKSPNPETRIRRFLGITI